MRARTRVGRANATTVCGVAKGNRNGPRPCADPAPTRGDVMTLQDAELDALWDHLWGLEDRINHGELLELSERMRDLLRSAAPTVAISTADAEAALATTESATALLLEIRKRIREGSHRIN